MESLQKNTALPNPEFKLQVSYIAVQMLYHLSYWEAQEYWRELAYPFSRESSQLRN